MNSKQRFRAKLVLFAIFLGAGALGCSLYWLQIVKGSDYRAKANSQYVKPDSTVFDRGTIYFSSKDGSHLAAATIESGYTVFMNPSMVTDPAQAYSAVSQYLTLDQKDFMSKATKPNDHYEVLADHVDASTTQPIKNLLVPGIDVADESWRSYPGGVLAAHTIGIVGEDASSSELTGRYGLESFYDSTLSRASSGGSASGLAQMFGGLTSSVFGSSVGNEGDVVTTIEPTAEKYLEKILADTSATWHPDEIGGIIMDPNTGAIIAMASLPTFDPNNTGDVKDVKVFSNPLVENSYEMGSIMKPLTMATALDTGAEQPDSTYNDTGSMIVSGKKISNYDFKARGVIPMQQILSQSLNVGAATIALKVGTDIGKGVFAKYFTSFGIGSKTGIDQPNETAGLTSNLKTGRDVEIATAAYGQGIAVSPVAMTRALAVLANGGYLVTPHVASEIDYVDGSTKMIDPVKIGPLISKKTDDEVTAMLVKVVDGTMATAHPDIEFTNYSIAAKTGTAQIADPVHGGYYSDRYLHSFFGYFPAHDPKFIVFLYQIYPKGAEYASATLTDPFSELAKFLIDYYNVAPDR